MRRATLIAALVAAACLGAGFARPCAAAAETAQAVSDQSVTLATVALPLVVDGEIVNYVFVSVKLVLTPQADTAALRDKEPFFRDALVRAAHRTPFVRAGDNNQLDEGKLKAALYREAPAIAGPGKIQSVVVLSQTPQHRLVSQRAAEGAEIVP